jgi:hypothetical protein
MKPSSGMLSDGSAPKLRKSDEIPFGEQMIRKGSFANHVFRGRGDRSLSVTMGKGNEMIKSFGEHVIREEVPKNVVLTLWLEKQG